MFWPVIALVFSVLLDLFNLVGCKYYSNPICAWEFVPNLAILFLLIEFDISPVAVRIL